MSVSEIIEKLTRPLVTILVVLTFCYGFIGAGKVTPEMLKDVVLIVVAFWFGQRQAMKDAAERPAPQESK